MSSRLDLSCADLAALVRRGLGARVETVTCSIVEGELRLVLGGLAASTWLPRLRLDIAVAPTLHADRQEVAIAWRVVPSSLTGLLAAPVQQLGVGSTVIDALIERLGWEAAVISRDNERLVLALQRLGSLQRLNIHLTALVLAESVQVHLTLEKQGLDCV